VNTCVGEQKLAFKFSRFQKIITVLLSYAIVVTKRVRSVEVLWKEFYRSNLSSLLLKRQFQFLCTRQEQKKV